MSAPIHVDEEIVTRCSECGFARGESLRTAPRWWSLWRVAPSVTIVVLIAWALWVARDVEPSFTAPITVPRLLDAPPVARAEVQAIVDETADAPANAAFIAALRGACTDAPRSQSVPVDSRDAFVSAGFFAPSTHVYERFSMGWPWQYVQGYRVRDLAPSSGNGVPEELPFVWFPPWPESDGALQILPGSITYAATAGSWMLGYGQLRFTSSDGWKRQRVAAIKLDTLSLPLAALWVGWALVGLVVRGWRRILLVGTCAAVLAALTVRSPTVWTMGSGGWVYGKTELWQDLRSLDLRTTDVLARLERPEGVRDLAELLLTRAPRQSAGTDEFLALAIGPTWRFDIDGCTFCHAAPLLRVGSFDDAAHIPADVVRSAPTPDLQWAMRDNELCMTFRGTTNPTQTLATAVHLGWLLWVAIAASIAWCLPAAIVARVRRRRARRRAVRAECLRCGHPLALPHAAA